MSPRPIVLFVAALLALAAVAGPAPAAAQSDLLDVSSQIVYDIRPDEGPVRVSWDVSIKNNDPSTTRTSFYQSLTLPVLRGFGNIAAASSGGSSLDISLDDPSDGPIIGATVKFDSRLFYQDTYSLTMTYELAAARDDWLLVTPSYVYLPVLALGDEATVTVNSPPDSAWSATVEPDGCTGTGSTFTCAGSDSVYVAALAEVVRPDALSSLTFDAALPAMTLNVTVNYFPGEDAFANHARDLTTAALPIIEDLFGFAYSGPATLVISQGGRQATYGNEGVATCVAGRCDIVVSPVGDDYTLIHELSHLWTGIYSRRWLIEGFAQIITEETVSRLPPGSVHGQPQQWNASAVDLQLDEWEGAGDGIGATAEEHALQEAGYDRSLRVLYLLRYQVGAETLERVNAALAAEGKPADSRHYLDLVEVTSGVNVDSLFADWVFPASYDAILADRREARDRLGALESSAREEGLSDAVPAAIRQQVDAWQFTDAILALDRAESGLAQLPGLRDAQSGLRTGSAAAGLTLPDDAEKAIAAWDFDGAAKTLRSARAALDAYSASRDKVNQSRSLWTRFGLLGSDPNGKLQAAAAAFASGDFEQSIDRSAAAADAIDNAGQVALRRLLIVGGILAIFALVILAGVWIARLREHEFA